MKYSERCCECGSWELECGSDKPVKDCGCVRCLSHTNKLLREALKLYVEQDSSTLYSPYNDLVGLQKRKAMELLGMNDE